MEQLVWFMGLQWCSAKPYQLLLSSVYHNKRSFPPFFSGFLFLNILVPAGLCLLTDYITAQSNLLQFSSASSRQLLLFPFQIVPSRRKPLVLPCITVNVHSYKQVIFHYAFHYVPRAWARSLNYSSFPQQFTWYKVCNPGLWEIGLDNSSLTYVIGFVHQKIFMRLS